MMYYAGYDCHYTLDSIELRGGCENRSEIRYTRKKRSYQIKSFVSNRKFREWKGGFGPNLIADSIDIHKSNKNQRLSANKLDEFLADICAIRTDSVFSYSIKEVPGSFLRSNNLTKKSNVSEIDSVIQKSFSYTIVSSVVGYLQIHFYYKGKTYSLSKGLVNPQWHLTYSVDEKEESLEFIYFAFDAFLLKELPKKFSGTEVLD